MSEIKLENRQKKILKQFRISLSDLLTSSFTDAELLKWLRAKNFDLKKAERHFRQIDLFRKLLNFEAFHETYVKPKVLEEYDRTCFLGFCKDGTPVRYTCLKMDIFGFLKSISQFDMVEYLIDLMERDAKLMKEHNRKTGQDHHKLIYIFDMEDFDYQVLSDKCVLELNWEFLRAMQDFFPEKWKYIFFINAPYIFYKVVNIFKPILKHTLIDKVKIASKSTTLELLKEYIDEDLIPARLGGKRVNCKEDIESKDFVNPYGKIPEEYYLTNLRHVIDEADPGVKAVTIRAQSCYNVPVIVKEAGTTVRMEFRTENGPINFIIFYRQFDSDPENLDLPESDEYIDPDDESTGVLPSGVKVKLQCHIAPNDGTFHAVWPGIYILQYDNTFSWFGSRKLYYRLTVTPPNK